MTRKRNKIVLDYAAWLRAVRGDLLKKLGEHGARHYLDLHVECLREGLLQAFTACHTPQDDDEFFVLAIDSLTTLRFASLAAPEWVDTGYPARHPRHGLPLSMFTDRNVYVMMSVLKFLVLHPLTPDMKPLSWHRLRAWLAVYSVRFGPQGLNILD